MFYANVTTTPLIGGVLSSRRSEAAAPMTDGEDRRRGAVAGTGRADDRLEEGLRKKRFGVFRGGLHGLSMLEACGGGGGGGDGRVSGGEEGKGGKGDGKVSVSSRWGLRTIFFFDKSQ